MIFSVFGLLGIFFVILQTTLLPKLPSWMGAPDLLFILLVYCALHVDIIPGLLLAVLFGFLLDITAGIFLGIHTSMYLLLFLLLQAISSKLALRYLQHQPVLTGLSYLLVAGGSFLFSSVLAEQDMLTWSWRDVLLGTLLVAIFSIPLNQFFITIHTLARPSGKKAQKKSRLQTSGNLP